MYNNFTYKNLENTQQRIQQAPSRNLVTVEVGWRRYSRQSERIVELLRLGRLTSSNNDVDREGISLGHSIVERKFATFRVGDRVGRQLRMPLLLPVGIVRVVILRVDVDTSPAGTEVCDNITPTLVCIDAQCDDEVLAGVRHETKGAGRSATAHREYLLIVNFAPRSAISILPDSLLDDAEECVRIGLVDPRCDCVTHSGRKKKVTRKGVAGEYPRNSVSSRPLEGRKEIPLIQLKSKRLTAENRECEMPFYTSGPRVPYTETPMN